MAIAMPGDRPDWTGSGPTCAEAGEMTQAADQGCHQHRLIIEAPTRLPRQGVFAGRLGIRCNTYYYTSIETSDRPPHCVVGK
jgi:hypothetical protein